jgi:hypothetical protein
MSPISRATQITMWLGLILIEIHNDSEFLTLKYNTDSCLYVLASNTN